LVRSRQDTLPRIATQAERLEVLKGGSASFRPWNNVIDFQLESDIHGWGSTAMPAHEAIATHHEKPKPEGGIAWSPTNWFLKSCGRPCPLAGISGGDELANRV
jgi:hypothetical protein